MDKKSVLNGPPSQSDKEGIMPSLVGTKTGKN